MPPLLRYAVFQVPGLIAVALLAYLLWRFAGLPSWLAAAAVLLWAAKDAAMYPLVHRAYEQPPHGAAALIGRRGVVRRRIAPRGTVGFGVELWNAESADRTSIESGAGVVVVATRGLTLVVEESD